MSSLAETANKDGRNPSESKRMESKQRGGLRFNTSLYARRRTQEWGIEVARTGTKNNNLLQFLMAAVKRTAAIIL